MVGLEDESAPTITKRDNTLGMQPLQWDSQDDLAAGINGASILSNKSSPNESQNTRIGSMKNKWGACLDMCLLEREDSEKETPKDSEKQSPTSSMTDNIVVSAVTAGTSVVVNATTIAASTSTSMRRNSGLMQAQIRKSHTSHTLNQAIEAAKAAKALDYTAQQQVILEATSEEIAVREVIIEKAQEIMMEKNRAGFQTGTICPVCTGEDVDTELLPCRHRLHAKCIKRWIETRPTCPVCRESVTDIEKCFGLTCPDIFKELDVAKAASSNDSNPNGCGCAELGEWGWFDDLDESERHLTFHQAIALSRSTAPSGAASATGSGAGSGAGSASVTPVAIKTYSTKTVPEPTTATSSGGGGGGGGAMTNSASSDSTKRSMSCSFEFCRTFPPLTTESPYASSKYDWMRLLSSHRHIAVKIQISTFRIVEATPGSSEKFAEYCVEMDLDGRHLEKWKRYSAFCRFIKTLQGAEYHQTYNIWRRITATGRWFNRLEVEYLTRRCKLLEEFACTLLHEAPNLFPLADMLEC